MAFEKIVRWSNGKRGIGDGKLAITALGIYLPSSFGDIPKVNLYFDKETRRIAIEPTEASNGYVIKKNRFVRAVTFASKFNIKHGTRAAAEWNEDKTMIISEPIEEAA